MLTVKSTIDMPKLRVLVRTNRHIDSWNQTIVDVSGNNKLDITFMSVNKCMLFSVYNKTHGAV